jgi:hypothetical protein
MPPSVALGVVHLASGRSALRARKPSTLREVNPQIKTTPRNIEPDIHDLPRLLEAKGSLKQVEIVHVGLPSSRIRSPADSQQDRTLPTQNSEEPEYLLPQEGSPNLQRVTSGTTPAAARSVDH